MWFELILGLLLVCMVDSVWTKRAFAIRMRGKSNSQGGGISRYSRKNHHLAHMTDNGNSGMVRNPPVPDVPPARSVGSSGPIGPPPAYPGLGNQKVPAGGAPPAYSRIAPPSYAEAMGYSSYGHNYGSAGSPGRHYDYNSNINNNNNLKSIYSEHNVAGYGSNYGYHRGSNPFNVGNIVAGVGLYHLGHSMLGHSGHDHHHHHHHGYNEHYPHRHHSHVEEEEPTRPTLPPEVENSHIQVNADFDFGPSPAPAPEPSQKLNIEPNQFSSLDGSTT